MLTAARRRGWVHSTGPPTSSRRNWGTRELLPLQQGIKDHNNGISTASKGCTPWHSIKWTIACSGASRGPCTEGACAGSDGLPPPACWHARGFGLTSLWRPTQSSRGSQRPPLRWPRGSCQLAASWSALVGPWQRGLAGVGAAAAARTNGWSQEFEASASGLGPPAKRETRPLQLLRWRRGSAAPPNPPSSMPESKSRVPMACLSQTLQLLR